MDELAQEGAIVAADDDTAAAAVGDVERPVGGVAREAGPAC